MSKLLSKTVTKRKGKKKKGGGGKKGEEGEWGELLTSGSFPV